ncbi:helix-turn-helix domain-containing protein [Chroococcidiopsis sp. FACHB-1243]|uniref:helix-turn-helix domain-containing protein n=1 Tax=Chroococcidiopsis sp. [FACHB-1243] TaxID=2692781 RepID=UPI001784B061|nr:helix-turn-helix domain-containing protein [Chroococcidiopsis sp. [FACHB-1243]]MBD2305595.1 helix-turn-helix domain-containing protein [Chroococcidiopsis sp. [FACHB-1243]]
MTWTMDKSNTSTGSKYNLLTWQQQQAVDLLLLGVTQEVIAAELGINRETLDGWCKNEFSFAEALASRRQELRIEAAGLENIMGRSIDRVERELNDNGSFEKEDVKVAFDIIKLLSPHKYLRISEQSA